MQQIEARTPSIGAHRGLLLWTRWVVAHLVAGLASAVLAAAAGAGTFGMGALGIGVIAAFVLGALQGWALQPYVPAAVEVPHSSKTAAGRVISALGTTPFRRVWRTGTGVAASTGYLIFLLGLIGTAFLPMSVARPYGVWFGSAAGVTGIAVLSVAQWYILRQYARGSLWWIPGILLGWILGAASAAWVLGPTWTGDYGMDGPGFVFVFLMACAGLVLLLAVAGMVTGFVLVWMLRW
ncbi:MAG TPA: hypothetical protein VM536_23405 [Chloroflexia bacterium]|nr:hypothetical protein [Chloroflexia bacterium]